MNSGIDNLLGLDLSKDAPPTFPEILDWLIATQGRRLVQVRYRYTFRKKADPTASAELVACVLLGLKGSYEELREKRRGGSEFSRCVSRVENWRKCGPPERSERGTGEGGTGDVKLVWAKTAAQVLNLDQELKDLLMRRAIEWNERWEKLAPGETSPRTRKYYRPTVVSNAINKFPKPTAPKGGGSRLGAYLHLDKRAQGLDPEHVSAHLRPHNLFIPLIGRQAELDDLSLWRDGREPFGWRAVVGSGGLGKTRLAHEFAIQTSAQGWLAGFVDSPSLSGIVQSPDFPRWMPEEDTLMVIDYAEDTEKLAPLSRLLPRLARWSLDVGESSNRVRVLLLARHGSLEDGWLAGLRSEGEGGAGAQLIDTCSPPLQIQPLEETESLGSVGAIVEATFDAWAERHPGRYAPERALVTPAHLQHLRQVTQGKPLFIQMAAWRACDAASVDALGRWELQDPLKFAVEKELRYIAKLGLARSLRQVVERAVALLTILGPKRREDQGWLRLLAAEAETLGYPHTDPGEIASAIIDLYGEIDEDGHQTALPIAPDFLAEAFTTAALRRSPAAPIPSLRAALALGGTGAWERFLRLVGDLGPVTGYEFVAEWLGELAEKSSVEELSTAALALPDYSVILGEFAVVCFEAAVHRARALDGEPDLARSLNSLGARLRRVDRPEDALEATEEAVKIYRRLAADDPDTHERDLAHSLNSLGVHLMRLDLHKEALEATEQAVEIRERLAMEKREKVADDADTYEADLARSLNDLGIRLRALDRLEESLAAMQRAVEIRERLAARHPDTYEPFLAVSLNNLGVRLRDADRLEEALAATERAVEIRERLAARHPDTYEPFLAASLNSLGIRLKEVKRFEEALAATKRAVEIRERLATRHPDAYDRELAKSLNSLGVRFRAAGWPEDAVAATERSVEIRERLAARHPDAYQPFLAAGLHSLGKRLKEDGRLEDALAATERAVDIRQRLADSNPDAHELDLAQSLHDLVARLRDLGRHEAARAAAEREGEIRKRRGSRPPDTSESGGLEPEGID